MVLSNGDHKFRLQNHSITNGPIITPKIIFNSFNFFFEEKTKPQISQIKSTITCHYPKKTQLVLKNLNYIYGYLKENLCKTGPATQVLNTTTVGLALFYPFLPPLAPTCPLLPLRTSLACPPSSPYVAVKAGKADFYGVSAKGSQRAQPPFCFFLPLFAPACPFLPLRGTARHGTACSFGVRRLRAWSSGPRPFLWLRPLAWDPMGSLRAWVSGPRPILWLRPLTCAPKGRLRAISPFFWVALRANRPSACAPKTQDLRFVGPRGHPKTLMPSTPKDQGPSPKRPPALTAMEGGGAKGAKRGLSLLLLLGRRRGPKVLPLWGTGQRPKPLEWAYGPKTPLLAPFCSCLPLLAPAGHGTARHGTTLAPSCPFGARHSTEGLKALPVDLNPTITMSHLFLAHKPNSIFFVYQLEKKLFSNFSGRVENTKNSIGIKPFGHTIRFLKFQKYIFYFSLVRPLFSITRVDTFNLCEGLKLPLYPDKSNERVHFLRNRLRKQVLPAIRALLNPQFETLVCNFSQTFF